MSKNHKTHKEQLARDVEDAVSVLGNPGEAVDAIEHTIEDPRVRAALKRNREMGDMQLSVIRPDPGQVRIVNTESEDFQGLVTSIKDHGVLQPIAVRWLPSKQIFQIIAGERRFQAAKHLGLKTIPAVIKDVDDTTSAIQQLVENVQRENLNPIEEARGYQRYLAATGATQRQLARKLGKSKAYVSQTLSLLEKLAVKEQEELAAVSPAKLPGKSLILEAFRTPDQTIRQAILHGTLTREEARKATRSRGKRLARPRPYTVTLRSKEPKATVIIRFPNRPDRKLVERALRKAWEDYLARYDAVDNPDLT